MPRKTSHRTLAKSHEATMKKYPRYAFNKWVQRHLQNQDNIAEYEKAFNLVHGVKNEEASSGDESLN